MASWSEPQQGKSETWSIRRRQAGMRVTGCQEERVREKVGLSSDSEEG